MDSITLSHLLRAALPIRRCVLGLTAALLAGACAAAPDAPEPLPRAQLKLALAPSTSMVYEPRRAPLPQPLLAGAGGAAPSLGLELRTPATQDGPRALLRLQLSAGAALQLRPRRGGLAISYRAEF